ncbi:hypothetical protein DI270_021015 [Microbispora triticiradicis]|uniref:Uncharacterized protein n=3 Tax=Microbispora TaxID=2005 RepID=A0ABY3LRZ4_9ACTN|nr:MULTISPECIES: hypothetical protein [Microbispora]RGA03080.1 hypothetical protein DI270_021015 [Microbispora triticiradicis]TLP54786.1 hypothetical protein FED44_26900 [Microbispora fusca]TYB51669.1 hypothetical protein FXF59_26170 [Microbispora tritici]GLW22623.1 hypothetical protein Mame01_26660 [Microbispora amethystogenes]
MTTAVLGSYPPLLDALHADVTSGGFVASPSGCVLASAEALGVAGPGRFSRFGLACVPASAGSARDDATAARFAEGLLALQHTVLRRTLAHTITRLGERVSEGTSLLARPQLQADLADVAMELQEEAAEPEEETGRDVRWARHQRLTSTGRVLLRLLGGYGMLAEGPGADLYLAEVAGNVYLQPGPDHRVRPETEDHHA